MVSYEVCHVVAPANDMLHVEALSSGPEVGALLGSAGRVLAVLRNAVYLESDAGHVVGIGGPDAPDGPLTLRVAALPALLAALANAPAGAFRSTRQTLTLEAAGTITGPGDRPWQTALPQAYGPADAQARALATLKHLLSAHASARNAALPGGNPQERTRIATDPPPDRGPATSAVEELARRRITGQLARFQAAWAGGAAGCAAAALVGLLGLGSGLTPAGDDVVAGLLAMLVWQERIGSRPARLVRPIAKAIREAAPLRTNRISARLLFHAASGVLYAPALAVGASLLAGDAPAVAATAPALLAIGHSSGADLALGLCHGLR